MHLKCLLNPPTRPLRADPFLSFRIRLYRFLSLSLDSYLMTRA
uniref:Uncharacterized protein n=1 Tax=Utricularia reniformis TaxID=192314 RepID=A0A1Y0B2W1_9LAMI|nr:hypothetical protein AEK19_MT1600 [Utricularia reniformis]ART31782.1 hypothetical protein AEK19_MT1600 [Utricularia reniformis]